MHHKYCKVSKKLCSIVMSHKIHVSRSAGRAGSQAEDNILFFKIFPWTPLEVLESGRFMSATSPNKISKPVCLVFCIYIQFYRIAFVRAMYVDTTLCQRVKFPSTLLLKFFMLYYNIYTWKLETLKIV